MVERIESKDAKMLKLRLRRVPFLRFQLLSWLLLLSENQTSKEDENALA